jgi:hypothetical protein
MAEIAEAPPRPGVQVLARILWFVVLPLMVVAALLLPPFSLYERVMSAGFTTVSATGGMVTTASGAQLVVPADAVAARTHIRLQPLDSLPADAAAALPPGLTNVGTPYTIDVRSQAPERAELWLPTPADAGPSRTLDAYAWDGTLWSWIPHRQTSSSVVLNLAGLPEVVILASSGPVTPEVGVALGEGDTAVPALGDTATLLGVSGLHVAADGSLAGSAMAGSPGGAAGHLDIIPIVDSKVDGVVRSDWVYNILADDPTWRHHAATLSTMVADKDYEGIAIDYRQLDPEVREVFGAFVQHLADRLHAENRQLMVVLDVPERSDSGWDTGAYDWVALGEAVDQVWLRLDGQPTAFTSGGTMADLLDFAVSRINRRKLVPVLSMTSRDAFGDQVVHLAYAAALDRLAEIRVEEPQPVLVGDRVRLDLPALVSSGGVHTDDATGASWFTYTDGNGQTHKVWLEDARSLAQKLDFLSAWNLQGVLVSDLSQTTADDRLWQTLSDYRAARAAAADAAELSVVWTVQGAVDTTQHVQPITASSLEWTAPEDPGVYQIQVGFSSDGGQSRIGGPAEQGGVSIEVEAPTPTPSPSPTPEPATPTPVPPTPTPLPAADAIVDTEYLNVRAGPSTNYEIVDGVSAGDELTVTGKNDASTWLKIETDEIEEGWIFADLVTVYVDLDDVTVAEAPPEPTPVAVAEKPAEKVEPAAAEGAPVAVAAPAPSGYRGFGYGIQAHMMDQDLNQVFSMINGMGFNWVKQQVEWYRIEPGKGQYNWGALDAIVNTANAHGVNVLFSVVKAPAWARPGNTNWSVEGPPANPQDFGDFMAAMAGRYRGRVRAYEIWNEQNLWYEWGGEPIDAKRYVQLLAAAYRGVKGADPGALVISGAPTPTGVTSNIAVDDALYLEQMYQAGLRAYSDGIGVHPSGYNNPPNASAGSWNDPSAPSFKGHRSFFFRDTLWTYYSIMQRYGDGGKKLWPTEFGWASVEGLGVGPAEGYGYAGDNSAGEQAQYLVQAFQLARSWGFVGPMFVWNLNFAPVSGPADEKAAFGVLDAGWGARPAYNALRDMPK